MYDQTQGSGAGFWCWVFLILPITLIPTQVSQVELFNPKSQPKSQIKVRIGFLQFGRPKMQMKQVHYFVYHVNLKILLGLMILQSL